MPVQQENCEQMLKESIKHFITAYSHGAADFSAFESIFFRLIQTMLDPPLGVTWFYSAVTSHASKLTAPQTPLTKMMLVKDLFQLLISCSNLSTGVKKIALLAPVVYELYNITHEYSDNGMCLLKKNAEDLVEKIVSYVSVCCDSYENVHEVDNVAFCIEDLIHVWTVDRVGESCKFGESARVFFPLVSEKVQKGVNSRYGISEVAGMVLCEVFLLRLSLKFDLEVSREDLLLELKEYSIQSIKGFRNCYFLDGLFKMLLDPSLPVSTLLRSEDAIFLQKVVYDAVILVDYSFILSSRCFQHPDKLRKTALAWSLVADNAIQFARRMSDQSRTFSYLSAFSQSPLLKQWITTQADMEEKSKQNICSPKALIKWLVGLEAQGMKIFDDEVLQLHAKVVCGNPILQQHELPKYKHYGKTPEASICSYTYDQEKRGSEGNGDEEMIDSFDGAITADTMATDVGRKRKEEREDVEERRVKLFRYNCQEEKLLTFSHGDAVNAGSS